MANVKRFKWELNSAFIQDGKPLETVHDTIIVLHTDIVRDGANIHYLERTGPYFTEDELNNLKPGDPAL